MAKTKTDPAPFTGVRPSEQLPSLRDLDESDAILREFLVESEGEVTPEIEGLEAWLATATHEKIERWGLWIQARETEVAWLEGQAAPFKTEFERLKARAKTILSAVERSEARLMYEMQKRQIPEVKGKLVTVKLVTNPPHVVGDGKVPVETLAELWQDPQTSALIAYQPEQFALNKAAVKNAVSLGALPEVLIAAGVGIEQGQRVKIS